MACPIGLSRGIDCHECKYYIAWECEYNELDSSDSTD